MARCRSLCRSRCFQVLFGIHQQMHPIYNTYPPIKILGPKLFYNRGGSLVNLPCTVLVVTSLNLLHKGELVFGCELFLFGFIVAISQQFYSFVFVYLLPAPQMT